MDIFSESAPEPGETNAPHEISVSELAGRLKRTIEDAYGFVRVRGELGRVTVAKSGHVYFDLKDADACLSSVMWKGQAGRLSFRPEEGLEVVAEGKLSTYPGRSNYQLICDRMRPAGVGALMQLLEERKKKLAAEGLFDPARKKPLPYMPRVIGVVTSPTGAVIRDILHRVRERFPVHVLIWPALVQGERAAGEVAAGIRGFNAMRAGGPIPRPDLIIVARGGGSIEDLWPFNEEIVVRAAADSAIPLISAVGHETDTTLVDYVSDRRAPTPTGAAEIAVPVRSELLGMVDGHGSRIRNCLTRGLNRSRLEFKSAAAKFPRLEALLQSPRQRVDLVGHRFAGALGKSLQTKRGRFGEMAGRLRPATLRQDVARRRREMERLGARLSADAMLRSGARKLSETAQLSRRAQLAIQRRLDQAKRKLETQARLVRSLSHESVLQRGFAIVLGEDGSLKRSATEISAGLALKLRFADGEATAVGGAGDPTAPKGEAPAIKPRIVRRKREPGDQGDLF